MNKSFLVPLAILEIFFIVFLVGGITHLFLVIFALPFIIVGLMLAGIIDPNVGEGIGLAGGLMFLLGVGMILIPYFHWYGLIGNGVILSIIGVS